MCMALRIRLSLDPYCLNQGHKCQWLYLNMEQFEYRWLYSWCQKPWQFSVLGFHSVHRKCLVEFFVQICSNDFVKTLFQIECKVIPYLFVCLFVYFKLGIFLIYISNAIPKVPHTIPPTPLPIHFHLLALSFPCTGAYKVCKSNGPLFPVVADWAIFWYICS